MKNLKFLIATCSGLFILTSCSSKIINTTHITASVLGMLLGGGIGILWLIRTWRKSPSLGDEFNLERTNDKMTNK